MADTDDERIVNRPLLVTAALALVAATGLSAWAYARLPATALVPVHWNTAGQIDGYASKFAGLFGPLAIYALAVGLVLLVPRIEPRRQNLLRSAGAFRMTAYALIALFVAVHALIVVTALGADLNVARLLPIAIGVLFVVIGNWLPQVRSSYTFGIRTPWTLASDYVWRRTHRAGGWAFVGLGLALMAAGAFLPNPAVITLVAGGTVLIIAGAFLYSYVLWRSAPDRQMQR